jgi:hypothetical protein
MTIEKVIEKVKKNIEKLNSQNSVRNYSLGWKRCYQSLLPDLESAQRTQNELIDMYKECFEKYIPDNAKDEATFFLSTYNNELSKDMAKREL